MHTEPLVWDGEWAGVHRTLGRGMAGESCRESPKYRGKGAWHTEVVRGNGVIQGAPGVNNKHGLRKPQSE